MRLCALLDAHRSNELPLNSAVQSHSVQYSQYEVKPLVRGS